MNRRSPDRVDWLRQMFEIRLFEDKVQELFMEGEIQGTTHLCQGQEVISELCLRGAPPARLAALSLPDDLLIPYSPTLEDAVIPSVDVVGDHMRHVLHVEG